MQWRPGPTESRRWLASGAAELTGPPDRAGLGPPDGFVTALDRIEANHEAYVSGGAGTDKQSDEPMKRVSIDVPESLHTRFKVACAKTRIKMAPEIIAFIEKRVKELEKNDT